MIGQTEGGLEKEDGGMTPFWDLVGENGGYSSHRFVYKKRKGNERGDKLTRATGL